MKNYKVKGTVYGNLWRLWKASTVLIALSISSAGSHAGMIFDDYTHMYDDGSYLVFDLDNTEEYAVGLAEIEAQVNFYSVSTNTTYEMYVHMMTMAVESPRDSAGVVKSFEIFESSIISGSGDSAIITLFATLSSYEVLELIPGFIASSASWPGTDMIGSKWISEVPEPSSALLFLAGLFGLRFSRRTKAS